MKWQPMDTAPKDGTPILVRLPDEEPFNDDFISPRDIPKVVQEKCQSIAWWGVIKTWMDDRGSSIRKPPEKGWVSAFGWADKYGELHHYDLNPLGWMPLPDSFNGYNFTESKKND